MKWLRWQGWNSELTPRARALLMGAGLLGIAAVSTSHLPQQSVRRAQFSSAAFIPDTTLRSVRDSIARARQSRSIPTVVYRRSAQVLQAENELRDRNLLLPLPELTIDQLYDSFDDEREDGTRQHLAMDIGAPMGTPVLSVDSGTVIKLHTSKDGGISVYAADPRSRFIYFYAHLLSYHPLIAEGVMLMPGDTLGFVGTTGNAKPDDPHLHFAILRASSFGGWSRGTPINPFRIWH
jgi:murein DD-endopeptidase MepM/ murein hydrolase activator NlpD